MGPRKKPRPRVKQSVNLAVGGCSHLLVVRNQPLPDVADLTNPQVGQIVGAEVVDLENDSIEFEAVPVGQAGKKRIAIRIKRILTADAVVPTAASNEPTEALLSITLNVALSVSGTTIIDTTPMVVGDVPVDYIIDDEATPMPDPTPPPAPPEG